MIRPPVTPAMVKLARELGLSPMAVARKLDQIADRVLRGTPLAGGEPRGLLQDLKPHTPEDHHGPQG